MPEEVSAQATKDPSVEPAQLERVERWAGDRLVPVGDDPVAALAPGTAFRTAYDEALLEIDAGLASPSPTWRRRFALVLGLQRILSEDKPHLADGLELRAHQVDALAGMLAALLGDAQRNWEDAEAGAAAENGNGNGNGNGEDDDAPPPLADDSGEAESVGAPLTLTLDFELEDDEESENGDEDEDDEDDDADEGDEPDDNGEENGEAEAEPLHDPGAVRRYRFKHPTASGKTVAAAGFVDAATITGVLILTHRRLLVEQFKRDLTQHGYGGRIREAILDGKRGPTDAAGHDQDVRVVHPQRRAAEPRRLRRGAVRRGAHRPGREDGCHHPRPRLADLHRHDGHRPAAAEARRRRVPGRGRRLPARRRGQVGRRRAAARRARAAGASLRRVRIVGGDFDQQELAQALDHDALNMAAAMYYQRRFGNKPGIVYSAGVDHAERVAAAMRVVGLKAAAVSGRTPPRELAFTLAAYERGEIDVLVNAQLLAEGWNAPRATVCMHLAPTASKRVYQQRIGRIMRLHRRKEAGVVVDFAEATAPHTDRTVTVHSLLGVDVYRPERWSHRARRAAGSAGADSRSRSSARPAGSSGHRRPAQAPRDHPPRLEADRDRPAAGRRAGHVGGERRPPRRPEGPAEARQGADVGPRQTRMRSSPPAPPRTSTASCA